MGFTLHIMKKTCLWICLGLFLYIDTSFGQAVKLKRRQLTVGISMLMPTDFTLISDDLLAKKYFTPKKPTAMYTSPDMEVDLGVNISNTFWEQQGIPLLKDLYKGSLRASYTKVEFISEGVTKINKRNYAFLEFVGIVSDSEEKANALGRKNNISKYNYLMYTVVENRIVIVNFNCPLKYQTQWQALMPRVMKSVKIKNLKIEEPKSNAASK